MPVKVGDVARKVLSIYNFIVDPSNTTSKACHPSLKLAHAIVLLAYLYALALASYPIALTFPDCDSIFQPPPSVQEITRNGAIEAQSIE